MQELGERLIELTEEQLNSIELDDALRSAVFAARSITARGALRRQKQLIGKLMRRVDADPIRDALNALTSDDRRAKRIFRDAEQWRNRLREGGDPEIDAFHDFLGRDSEAVREAVLNCRRAISDRDIRTTATKLFREIHREIEGNVQNGGRSI